MYAKTIRFSRTVLTVMVVNLLATSGDFTQSWTSPMYVKLYSNDSSTNPLGRAITEDEDSWIGSLVNIGAVLGAIPAGIIADKTGRKNFLIGIAIPHIVAYFTYAFATSVYLFYIGRFINGISLGAGYAILPMYIAEITEDFNRAALSVTLNIFWTFGNFLPYAIGPYLPVRTFNLILGAVPCTFLLLFILIGTETPHYLVHKGRHREAEEAIMTLRSCNGDVAKKEVQVLAEVFKTEENGSLMSIFQERKLRKALIISLGLVLLQQLSGIIALSYYLQPIFDAAESSLPSSTSSSIYGIFLFITSFPATFIVEKFGKKIPLGVSCLGDALSLGALGAFFYLKENTDFNIENILWLPIAALISYIFFFNLAFAVLPWTIPSELFPNNVKAISASSVAASYWLSCFFITRFFNKLVDAIGKAGTFWLYGGACLFAVVFDILWVPETKGKSFKEIQEML